MRVNLPLKERLGVSNSTKYEDQKTICRVLCFRGNDVLPESQTKDNVSPLLGSPTPPPAGQGDPELRQFQMSRVAQCGDERGMP